MQFFPLYDKILVRRVDKELLSPGGIVMVDKQREKPQEGAVVSVGEGRLLDSGQVRPLSVKKGDHVMFGKYAGNDVLIDHMEYIIIHEDELLGVFRDA